jgi:hypothetical protein
VADCQLIYLRYLEIAPGRLPRRANIKQSRWLTCTCIATKLGWLWHKWAKHADVLVVHYPALHAAHQDLNQDAQPWLQGL